VIPHPPVSVHSPERKWRVWFCLVAASGIVLDVVLHSQSVLEVGVGLVLAAGLAVLASRISKTCLVADAQGLTDVGVVRRRQVPWTLIAKLEVGRPGALWGGYCIKARLLDGGEVDLLSTRAYSMLPSRVDYDELHRVVWTLDEIRPNTE
jgi:hypothetical protein